MALQISWLSCIRKALDLVSWKKLFRNKNIHIQGSMLNEIILNIFSNFVRNKMITCNDKDESGWMKKIKSK